MMLGNAKHRNQPLTDRNSTFQQKALSLADFIEERSSWHCLDELLPRRKATLRVAGMRYHHSCSGRSVRPRRS
jgi:hypothetical protein